MYEATPPNSVYSYKNYTHDLMALMTWLKPMLEFIRTHDQALWRYGQNIQQLQNDVTNLTRTFEEYKPVLQWFKQYMENKKKEEEEKDKWK